MSLTLMSGVEELRLLGFDALNVTGNELNNTIVGNIANNTLIGGAGNDTLSGGLGSDTYQLSRGDGVDTIVEKDTIGNSLDVLQFGSNIAADQLWFSRGGNDLLINVIGTSDSVIMKGWYDSATYHVEQLKSGNGLTLSDSNVQNLVNAMAGIAAPSFGQMTLSSAQHAVLDGVIAANWS